MYILPAVPYHHHRGCIVTTLGAILASCLLLFFLGGAISIKCQAGSFYHIHVMYQHVLKLIFQATFGPPSSQGSFYHSPDIEATLTWHDSQYGGQKIDRFSQDMNAIDGTVMDNGCARVPGCFAYLIQC